MTIKELRRQLGDTQTGFAERYNIPFRTIQNWENGVRKPPQYILEWLEKKVLIDLKNRRTRILPKYDENRESLPKRSDYIGAISWLKEIQKYLGENVVFALDEALMCQGNFAGRDDEYLIWVYGDDSLRRFNGVVVLGNQVSDYCIKKKNGLRYTDLNRTLADSFANEAILDMQGITEALSKYYYSHENSFDGIAVVPEYQDEFEKLAKDAIEYYQS